MPGVCSYDPQPWSHDVLTDGQLALLRHITGGDDLSGSDGVAARISAPALQRRRLVDVTRKGGKWRAQVTADGEYLALGSRYGSALMISSFRMCTANGSLDISQMSPSTSNPNEGHMSMLASTVVGGLDDLVTNL